MRGPDVRQGFRRLRRAATALLGIAVVVVGLAYGFIPSFRSAINNLILRGRHTITNSIPHYPQVYPTSVTANMHERGHPGLSAMDNGTNTYWLAPWNPAHEPMLTAKFSQKVRLIRVQIWSGVPGNYVANGRPATLRLVFSNGHAETLKLQDTPKMQTLAISHAAGVDSVKIWVTSVDPGTKHSDVAIAEISWFRVQL
jgi:hypothetical protein